MIRSVPLLALLALSACYNPKVPASNPPTAAPAINIAPTAAPIVAEDAAVSTLPLAPSDPAVPAAGKVIPDSAANGANGAVVAPVVGMANPASVFCTESGLEYVMDGATGYCKFPDGSLVEEWAYYRSKHP